MSAPARPAGAIAFVLAVGLAISCLLALPLNGYVLNVLLQASTYAIAVFGLSVVLGLCGQINLAQAAFFGLGAYSVGLGTTDFHLSFWVSLVMGTGLALLAGGVLGASTLRLGGHYLAMVTISFQQIMTLAMVNWIGLTHGPDGISGIARPLWLEQQQRYLAFCAAVLATVGYLVFHLPDTRLGRCMRAVRDNELAAGVCGISVFRTKVSAFALSALLGALGGGLFSGGFSYISPDQFSFAESVVLLTMALLGGVASPIGAAIGTGLLILIPEWLRFLKSVPGLYLAIYGLAVILIVAFMPDGIWGFLSRHLSRLNRRPTPSAGPQQLLLQPENSGSADVLELIAIAKYFGGLRALDGVNLRIKRGSVHALIGPNGSGKTTLLNVLSGLYRVTSGRLLLEGRDITDLSPHARATAGLGRTFQNIRLFRSMSVLDNVIIGAERNGNVMIRHRGDLQARALAAIVFVGLGERVDEPITSFSYGHQRLIEIARALAGNPTVLLLDEPAAGLNSSEKLILLALLNKIAATGLTIVIIDHDMTLVARAANHITVLNFGKRIADGEPDDALRHPDVISAYLGMD
jgi:branched-chain amino acid transport system permease protein